MGRIPERWKEYSGSGKPIKDVPIFAFKTPLAKKYSSQREPEQEYVEEENEFTPSDLCTFIEGIGYKIVVIVDLTNTFRYYNGVEEFGKTHNIQYEKVKCEGQKLPNDDVMNRVANIVSDVIFQHGRDSKKVVGIHCTHGVNRTGYLVVRYMIEWLGYEPKEAIEAFNVARGHILEREKYLEDLETRKPGKRYEEWKKHRMDAESVNGSSGMNLWTDFDDKVQPPAADDTLGTKQKHQFHPYSRNVRMPQNYRGFPPRGGNIYSQRQLRPPFYRGKWARSTFNNGATGHNFYDDDYPVPDFSAVSHQNDQLASEPKKDAV